MTKTPKKLALSTLFFSIAILAFAPNDVSILIIDNPPIEPFKKLVYAIGMVETLNDTSIYNPVEEAVGFLQIRPIRIEDYNARTGQNYTSKDMYNYEISEKVFLFYAAKIGPHDFERIARKWNGSGKKTLEYWNQVKEYL